jgi:oligopeptide transport system permease protein
MSKQYDKSMFSLVQENDRLADKALKTKQLSYFQDAMLRFTRNKYNVIATIVLALFILMSIFVPIITPERFYNQTNSTLTTLPPRVPLLESLGFLDGTKLYEDQPIDYSTIDSETGLGYPTIGFDLDFIKLDTLTNRIIVGTERSPLYVGGVNELYVNSGVSSTAIIMPGRINFFLGTTIVLDIESMNNLGVLEVYLSDSANPGDYENWDELTLLSTVTTSGETVINPFDVIEAGTSGSLIFRYVLPEPSVRGLENVVFNSIDLQVNGESVQLFDGYLLSTFSFFVLNSSTENGRFLRKDAEMTVASFRYDEYGALFADQPTTIGAVEYEKILLDHPGMAESITLDPENPTTWTFDEGFPIARVTNFETFTIAGRQYINYQVELNGSYALGFEDIPYFIFGTDVFGKDLFTLIWLGLRTSLLLGFLSAVVNIVLGIIWGATSAYYGGQVDILMERFTDVWGSFPSITMIGIITVLIGPGFLALFIFMVYDGWIGAAKVTRFQFYRYKGSEYVLAARTLGASDRRIIFKHILPNALGTIVTRVILSIPTVIFLEVNLSYLGFGIGNGQKLVIGPVELTGTSIGVILNDGQQQIYAGNLWMIIFPALVVAILMITFNMFGNALRDALNPQLRGSE